MSSEYCAYKIVIRADLGSRSWATGMRMIALIGSCTWSCKSKMVEIANLTASVVREKQLKFPGNYLLCKIIPLF